MECEWKIEAIGAYLAAAVNADANGFSAVICTETEEARVEPRELLADCGIVGEVVVSDLCEFRVLQIGCAATIEST